MPTARSAGGKPLHAWIAAAVAIPVDRYSETSQRWHVLIKEAALEAGLDPPDGALDAACHRPTQVMRLPGAEVSGDHQLSCPIAPGFSQGLLGAIQKSVSCIGSCLEAAHANA